jgi:primosomal protein N' (replication factor Y) (superfamily II helicase)
MQHNDSTLDALDSLFAPQGTPLMQGNPSRKKRVGVLLPVALDAVYDYALPDGIDVVPGSFVTVPFGRQERLGVVWDLAPDPESERAEIADSRLKAVTSVVDVPPLPAISRRFVDWIARYTLAPRGMALKLMMGASAAFEPEPPRFGVRLVDGLPAAAAKRLTPGRARVIELAGDGLSRARASLAKEAGVSSAVIDGLIKLGALVEVEIGPRRMAEPNPSFALPELNPEQAEAAHVLKAAVDARNFSVSLLDGITGSGKTEVYFEAVAQALAAGRQIVVLLPEIALTSGFADRFKARFGAAAAEWHSTVGQPERGRVWRAAATGEARVVIGARSALFLPYRDLGLIVVDEEHDQSFKQEDRVSYQGRDMAVVRGSLGECPVILASATPSIESHVNALAGRYRHLKLKSRFSGNALPNITPIDLRTDQPETGRWLSPTLVREMVANLAKGEQSLLFLNRRGYAPLTLCRSCGHRFQCPQCTAWLVEHRFRGRLNCHHCGFSLPVPEKCPSCETAGSLVACGPGVERVAEEVKERFPAARTVILSSDLTPSMKDLRDILLMITRGEADIIIGTQIVAKGHNFPGLTMVGIVDGDLGLGGADPRAAERSFQLLHQVTGRAGRAEKPGRGFLQTHLPEHPVMQAIVSGDREAFLDREIAMRQAALMPPFGRLAALIISGSKKPAVEEFARLVARHAPDARRIEVLGPAEAPIALVRGRHRQRILLKAPKELDLQTYLRAWLGGLPKIQGDLRLQVDVDPYNFL